MLHVILFIMAILFLVKFSVQNYITHFWNIFNLNWNWINIVICSKPFLGWFLLDITNIVSFRPACTADTALKFYHWYCFKYADSISWVPFKLEQYYYVLILIWLIIYLMLISSVDAILFWTSRKPSSVSIPRVRITMRNFISSVLVIEIHFSFLENEFHPLSQ